MIEIVQLMRLIGQFYRIEEETSCLGSHAHIVSTETLLDIFYQEYLTRCNDFKTTVNNKTCLAVGRKGNKALLIMRFFFRRDETIYLDKIN